MATLEVSENTVTQAVNAFKTAFENAKNKKFVFLLAGRSGVGKSSTVNSLLGTEVAPVGKYKPTTFEVKKYELAMNEATAQIVDTPGLCDDLGPRNDQRYLELIQKEVRQFHCLWFVSRLSDHRLTADETRALGLITQTFTRDVWRRSVIVLTHAADSEIEDIEQDLKERGDCIRAELARRFAVPDTDAIPVVAVENISKKRDRRPDLDACWGELYTKVFSVIEADGALPFAIFRKVDIAASTKEKLSIEGQRPQLVFTETNKREIQKRINALIIPTAASVGASIGAALGPVAAAMGGAVGAALGFIAWIFS